MNDRAPSPAAFALLECAFHVLWVMYCSCFGLMGSLLATRLGGVDEDLLTLAIFVASVLVVAPVAQKMGGLSMNPANETALLAAGKIGIKEAAVRVPATMVGGTLGAGMLLSILPQEYVNFVPTPSLKPGVTLAVGFAVELLLSFVNNFILLLCMGRPGRFFQLFPLGITLASLVLFQAYTGPMMNPALGFSWGYHLNNVHDVETQLVYIGAPLVGAFSAGVAWKMAARPMKTGRIKDKRGRED